MGNKNTKATVMDEPITKNITRPIPIKRSFKHKYQEDNAHIFDEPVYDNFFEHMRLIDKKPKPLSKEIEDVDEL